MKLQTRVIITFLCIAVLVMILVGIILPVTLNQQSLDTVTENSKEQLNLLDYSLISFINSAKSHILELSMQTAVKNRNDQYFTNYLNVTEETFKPGNTEEEKAIIEILYNYETTHPYVNSVYMGRENGAFVRSHPRANNTAYDPRTRPWYTLAKENPDSVVITEAYRSITTPDVNIGVVKALLDEDGSFYGVVGADITLEGMTSFITGFDPGRSGEIIITDNKGTILAEEDSLNLFTDVGNILNSKKAEFLSTENGVLPLEDDYLIYYTSNDLGWKIGLIVPSEEVDEETNEAIFTVLTYLIIALVILSVLSLIVLNREIIRPLSSLTEISRRIADTGDLEQDIPVAGTDEIGILATAFKDMVERIKAEEKKLNQAIELEKEAKSELKKSQAELETKVIERTSQLAKANEHLKELDRLKSMFIASMSHELRTPLNSIIGFTVILLKGWSGEINDEQRKQLQIVENSSRHLLSLINDVIDISKIEAGKMELSLASFDLIPVLKETISSFEEKAKEQNLVLTKDIPERLDVYGDERRTRQVLINMIGNAVKFTDEGSVHIKAESEGDNLLVSVSDTGIGIPEDKINDLFKPFIRIPTEGRLTEGTGLGLYLSQKIVTALGGRITVKSTLGKGSEFILTLPVRSEKQ
ncbi:MAG: HAMP domain-containing protein [Methanomicrobiaceae archaeon]|nr:HAMP domain-containing protein [Methanomicrobiaceae archaeon]